VSQFFPRLLGEDKGDREAQAAELEADRVFADSYQLSDVGVERDGPLGVDPAESVNAFRPETL